MNTMDPVVLQTRGVIEGEPNEIGVQLITKLVMPALVHMHAEGGKHVSMAAVAGVLSAVFALMTDLYGRERGAAMARMAAEAFEEAQAAADAALKH